MSSPSATRIALRHLQSGFNPDRYPPIRAPRGWQRPEGDGECPPETSRDRMVDFQKDAEAFLRKYVAPALKRRGWKVVEVLVYEKDESDGDLDTLDAYIDVEAKAGQKIGLGGRKYIVLDRNVDYQDDQEFGFAGEMTEEEITHSQQWDVDEIDEWYEQVECPPDEAGSFTEGGRQFPLNAAGVEKILEGFDRRWMKSTGIRSKVQKKASTNTDCQFYKATDGKWYMDLEDYDEDEDGEQIEGDYTSYGPFSSFKAAEKYLSQNFANPGGYMEDDSGRRKPPRKPVSPRGRRWAFNKYNPDELLMQLVEILEKHELDDAVDAIKKVTPEVQRAWRGRERLASVSRVASRHLEARNPPLHEAAKADEAMGEAYRSLVDLKLGFDSWEEIPQSARKLYDLIGKAISAVGNVRKETYQIRMMVQRGKYAGRPDTAERYAANVKEIRAQLEEISGHITTHEAKQAADTQDWGYAGDLDHTKILLAEVTRFLNDDR
jgi:hypothetical protein